MADDKARQLKTLETTIIQATESPYPLSSELEGYERVALKSQIDLLEATLKGGASDE